MSDTEFALLKVVVHSFFWIYAIPAVLVGFIGLLPRVVNYQLLIQAQREAVMGRRPSLAALSTGYRIGITLSALIPIANILTTLAVMAWWYHAGKMMRRAVK